MINKRTEKQGSLSEVNSSVDVNNKKGGLKKFFAFLGPAYLVSVGYMDPGNWATDIAGGSQYGYKLLWVLLMSNLIALLLQSLSARLGIVRGRDLAQASRETYPKFINFYLYILAEIAIAACDLAEVLGMAIGLQLLFDIPLIAGVLISVLDTFILLFLINYGIRKIEAFIIALIICIGCCFLAEMIFIKPSLSGIAHGLIPSSLDGNALYLAIGIIGATVMPHNLYLHSALVQTRKFGKSKEQIKRAIKFNIIDSAIALNLAFFVNAAILILAAKVFFENGLFEVGDINNAHELLAPIIGTKWAPILFAVALIAAGQSSTITGTLAGQIVMEGYLNLRIQPWVRRLLTRSIAIIPSVFAIYYFGEAATGKLLVLSQVILSLQLGFAIIPLIHFVSDKHKMKGFEIKMYVRILAWLSAIIIVLLNVQLVINELQTLWQTYTAYHLLITLTIFPVVIMSMLVLLYVSIKPFLVNYKLNQLSTPHGNLNVINLLERKTFQHVAITVDFSSADNAAFNQAVIQTPAGAQLTLIHIVETAGALVMGHETDDHESEEDKLQMSIYREFLEKKGYAVGVELGYGNPKKQIPILVEKCGADLLIMAAHGHKGIKDFILGTTLDSVRHNVKIPVLIISNKE